MRRLVRHLLSKVLQSRAVRRCRCHGASGGRLKRYTGQCRLSVLRLFDDPNKSSCRRAERATVRTGRGTCATYPARARIVPFRKSLEDRSQNGSGLEPRMRPAPLPLRLRRNDDSYSNLKIELIDVFLGKDMRRPEENLAAVNDLQLA
jgi:hypothetical protein